MLPLGPRRDTPDTADTPETLDNLDTVDTPDTLETSDTPDSQDTLETLQCPQLGLILARHCTHSRHPRCTLDTRDTLATRDNPDAPDTFGKFEGADALQTQLWPQGGRIRRPALKEGWARLVVDSCCGSMSHCRGRVRS